MKTDDLYDTINMSYHSIKDKTDIIVNQIGLNDGKTVIVARVSDSEAVEFHFIVREPGLSMLYATTYSDGDNKCWHFPSDAVWSRGDTANFKKSFFKQETDLFPGLKLYMVQYRVSNETIRDQHLDEVQWVILDAIGEKKLHNDNLRLKIEYLPPVQ